MDLIIERLDTNLHDRQSFDCGVLELNIFLKQHANQNQSKNMSKTYVAVVAVSVDDRKKIYGYYTLSAGHIKCEELPEVIKTRLPNYPIPVARLGRLAVDKDYKGQGIGGFLLHDALTNVLGIADKMGVFAVVVDAKNDNAKSFYENYGFSALQDSKLTLFLPVSTIKSAV
ncbi:MAG TPA: GNAT family N-acetyltransferase [Gammaproteobacteria bacterium]|nr:GNAT family N-acetyltransferase [Gammaproteobacteria bacterium]